MRALVMTVLFFGGFILIGFAFRAIVYAIYNVLFNKFIPRLKRWAFNKRIETEPYGFSIYRQVLYQKLPYFQLLNDKEQRVFVHRLLHIKHNKNFIGKGVAVTEEMEVLVSAAITQLTFGLVDFELPQLHSICITPGSFYSPLLQANVAGLTFESGKVILSWEDFTEGYRIGNDRLNLGLHELAHVFMLGRGYPEIEDDFNEWYHLALNELQILRTNGNGILRDYASTNMAEFWACCVECFFESPHEFKKAIPALYTKTSLVLNQDMSHRLISCKSPVYATVPNQV